MKTSNYIIFFHISETDEFYLVHGYTGAVDLVSAEVANYLLERVDPNHTWHIKDQELVRETLRGRELGEVSDDTIGMLRSRGYLTDMSSAEELNYVEHIASFLHNRNVKGFRPRFMMVPSYECNLRCPYCFETDTRIELGKLKVLQKVMTETMVDAAFDSMEMLVKQRLGAKGEAIGNETKYITLYGGEPMMAETLPIVEYILHKGLSQGYRFGAITNAVDLDRYIHLLGPDKIGFLQITLDGPREIHNKKRVGPRYKQGTYDMIVSNIKKALPTGTHVSVRFHVDFKNISQVKTLIDDLESEGFHEHDNFEVYTYPVHNFHRGQATPDYPLMAIHHMQREIKPILESRSLPIYAQPEQMPRGKELKVLASDEGIELKLRAYVKDKLPGLYSRGIEPCSATTGLYIFDPFWKIYTCWDSVGMVGHETGTYSPAGPALNARNDDWLMRSPATIDECKNCKYAFFHFGGCASLPIGVKGTIFGPACYEFQDNFLYAGQAFFKKGIDQAFEGGLERDAQSVEAGYQEAGH